jgi:hypothetical protein
MILDPRITAWKPGISYPHRLERIPQLLRARAADFDGYAEAVSVRKAFIEAADIAEKEIQALQDEVLTIEQAASEFGWSYEALRRRVAGSGELNAGVQGAPRVRRSTMALLGYGRGPSGKRRTTADSHESFVAEPESSAVDLDHASPRFAEIFARAAGRSAQGVIRG